MGLSNDRSRTLAVLITGLISARTVNLSHLAGGFCGPAKLSSNYRRLQRFFQYVRIDEAWLARTLVALLRLEPPYRLCLDRTNWKVGAKDVNLLVLCIVARRVRIPLLWSMLEGRGNSSTDERKALIERYIGIFGLASIRMLLADREFVGSKWFEFLVENDIPFAIRVKADLIVTLDDGRVIPLSSLARRKHGWKKRACHRGRFQDMAERFAGTLAFAAKRRSDGTLIIVATNRQPLAALHDYKKRWQIECLFGDTKTRGLNMEDTRLTQPAKLGLLTAIVALALAWAHACASTVKGRADIERASHGYRRKSWFRTGFDRLRHWIAHRPQAAILLWNAIWQRPFKQTKKPIRAV
jgi:hypothetical protein